MENVDKKSTKEDITKILDKFASTRTLESPSVTYGDLTLVFRALTESELAVRDRYIDFANNMTATRSYMVTSMAAAIHTINGVHIEDYIGYEPVDSETGEKKTVSYATAERIEIVLEKIFESLPREVQVYFYENGYKLLENKLGAAVAELDKKKSLISKDDGEGPLPGLSEDIPSSIITEPMKL